jgi:hypothetical protein
MFFFSPPARRPIACTQLSDEGQVIFLTLHLPAAEYAAINYPVIEQRMPDGKSYWSDLIGRRPRESDCLVVDRAAAFKLGYHRRCGANWHPDYQNAIRYLSRELGDEMVTRLNRTSAHPVLEVHQPTWRERLRKNFGFIPPLADDVPTESEIFPEEHPLSPWCKVGGEIASWWHDDRELKTLPVQGWQREEKVSHLLLLFDHRLYPQGREHDVDFERLSLLPRLSDMPFPGETVVPAGAKNKAGDIADSLAKEPIAASSQKEQDHFGDLSAKVGNCADLGPRSDDREWSMSAGLAKESRSDSQPSHHTYITSIEDIPVPKEFIVGPCTLAEFAKHLIPDFEDAEGASRRLSRWVKAGKFAVWTLGRKSHFMDGRDFPPQAKRHFKMAE